MPVFFLGHGSPMNAVEENDFTKMLNSLASTYGEPNSILVISAHWMTQGTFVTQMEKPRTIHDFRGFPDELFQIQYPAPGNPILALNIINTLKETLIHGDLNEWGLDHGTWSLLRHLYPRAHVPVLQLSLDMTQTADYHFQLGQKLQYLRKQGVLIIGSGNIVHNLQHIRWETAAAPYDWAVSFDKWCKEKIMARDFEALIHDFNASHEGKMSVPTTEHYYPLLYALGASGSGDEIQFDYEGIQNGSISMRCVSWR